MLITFCLASLAFVGSGHGHMELTSPPDLGGKSNPNNAGNIDYTNTAPLANDGSNFPCKGRLSLLGTPQGKTAATWPAGSHQEMEIRGGSPHNGGSCQASLSLDQGKTWKVIHSWIGGCPLIQERSIFKFTIPADTPATEQAVFAWTWFNKVGNREMYMGCSPVEITAEAATGTESLAFLDRPNMFIANINSCKLQELKSVKFPDPGPAVDTAEADAVPPSEICGGDSVGGGAVAAPAPDSGSGDGSSSSPEGFGPSGYDSRPSATQLPGTGLLLGDAAGSPGAAGSAGLLAIGTAFRPADDNSSPSILNLAPTSRPFVCIVAAQVVLTLALLLWGHLI